jgi:integrase
MAQTRGKRDYLFKRSETGPWWIKLQPPKRMTNGKLVEKSLRTTDRAHAELLALPYIDEHKRLLLATRIPEGVAAWRIEFAPGLHDAPDGIGKIFATERELHYLDADGRVRIKGPNGGLAGAGLRFALPATGDRPSLATKDEDDALLETYIAHKGLKPGRAKEARDLFHLFKATVGKPLAKCDRSDGRKVVAALGDVKSATFRRKMVPLVAMANFGISEGRLTFNPFAGCVADRDDSERRLPFDDADMALIRANLLKLSVQDQLLVRTLATTGMRLSEAFEIDREQMEGGCRFVIVGTKTDQSLRRVPLPTALVKHLPKPIKGKLFAGLPNAASTRLAKWLRDECGITDSAKVAAHSYRHRAKDRLRMKHPRVGRCPEDVAEEIFGRDKKTIAAGYGKGSPVPDLKEWIDRIGF